MKNYRLYLFDFDYTLVNSESAILKCFHITLDKTGWPQREDDDIRRTIGLPMMDAIKEVIQSQDEEKAHDFLEVYKGEADRYMTAGTHFFPHTLAVLRALREQGAKIGIISSKTRHRIQEKFTADGVPELIDRIIGSDDVAAHKPAPEGILKALDYFQIPKEQVLYTGDSYVDAGAAQNAGVDFAAVTTGTTTAQEFQNYPHVKIMQDIQELLD
ncbi:MAG: HAD-IA family hydrolase [Selenomonadaceae bacterium]|nr:HAD-IA family hydrolase [Selenomonadaceae bacterium]